MPRSSFPVAAMRLFFQVAAVVAQRTALLARGRMPAREAVRMVAEKPAAAARATIAAGGAAATALLRRPLDPAAAISAAARAGTQTISGTVRGNRKRLSRRRR